jgi:hypothetical protein
MTQLQAAITLIIALVIAPKDRYRRAGFGFMKGENRLEVTEEQLAILQADPRLKVTVIEETKPEAPPAKVETKVESTPPEGETSDDTDTGGSPDDASLDITGIAPEVGSWVAVIHECVKDGSLKTTGSGVPDIKALEAAVEEPAGVKLTAEMRDAAWAEYQRLTETAAESDA